MCFDSLIASSQSRSAQPVLKVSTCMWCCKIHDLFWLAVGVSIRLAEACTFCLVVAAHSII